MTASPAKPAGKADSNTFSISRLIDAPRDLVWKVHTELDHMKRWWGPKGFTVFAATMELRPGGVFHYGMRSPQGQEMWGKFVYREIIAPERLVYVGSFSDAAGGTTRHPLAPGWPQEMLTAMTFSEQGKKTLLYLESRAINASEAERTTFEDGFASMTAGYGGTFDVLADYLKTLSA